MGSSPIVSTTQAAIAADHELGALSSSCRPERAQFDGHVLGLRSGGYATRVGERQTEIGSEAILEQGDELLRASRDLLADIDAQLSASSVQNPGDSLRTNDPNAGDS